MPDHDLTGLSTRSFEQMIQALACKVIGPGILVFGDGPDGGREATFKGKLSAFPSPGKGWDGYLVIQAKFCQRPKGKPKEDGKWALEQLRKELEAFAKRHTKREGPQFYILATNVVLSGVQRVGGKDSLSRVLDEYKKKIGIKDYRIWDYDQICRFLDADEDVRHAYGAWITPGDVLAKLAAIIDKKAPDFGKVMVNFLQKELLDDHFSKLEQAGHSPENRIPLEEVFVDLPAFEDRKSEAPNENASLPPGFLAEMLLVGSTCLRPEEPGSFGSKEGLSQSSAKDGQGRFVLVGGPGQGKSTLAQFLSQIQRANLLKDKRGVDSEVKDAVKSIVDHCSAQHLPLGIARRFPLRLELARFAKVLASQTETGVNSVLSYVAYIVKDRTDYRVAVDDLRRWLEVYPWLVVLDGLDEVPASSNRGEVLAAIRDFLVDVSMCNGDVLILATTRPQGYHDEFSPQRYQHRWLAPLSNARALHYGQTLVELTYAHNAQRKKEVLVRLKNAASTRATARLMESPLQVTIMTRLLAQVAQPPQERYRLFQQYYKVIYRREMERGVEVLSQLLRDHEANVDSIHYRTGLLLQMESERTRHTDATITINEFKAVVADRLQDEGYSGDALQRLAEAIATSATDRLVFLVPSQSDRVGFEIRSLQEFMAAEALMDGPDELVVERVRAIAPVPFWQNVLLFAAGKCFAERQWLRDCISQVCGELNDNPGDNLAHLILAGSRMAVSLLEDGPARRQPAYAQALARCALKLLTLPPEPIHARLADVFEQSFQVVYREELYRELHGGDFERSLAAWVLVSKLAADRGITWAEEMAELCCPKNPMELTDLLRTLEPTRNRWAIEKYAGVFFDIPFLLPRPHMAPPHVEFIKHFLKDNELAAHALKLHYQWPETHSKRFKGLTVEGLGYLTFPIVNIVVSRERLYPFESLGVVHQYWQPLKVAAGVVRQISTENIAHALEAMSEVPVPLTSRHFYASSLPWPILACLAAARSKDQICNLATRMRRGDMGGPDQWAEAEARWQSKGIQQSDLAKMTDEQWPIPTDIGKTGFPFACLRYGWSFHHSTKKVDELEIFWRNLPGTEARTIFADLILRSLFRPARMGIETELSIGKGSVALLADIISNLDTDIYAPIELVLTIFSASKSSIETQNALDHLGRKLSFLSLYGEGSEQKEMLQELAKFLASWLEQNPSRDGLVNLLALLAATVPIDRVPGCLKELGLISDPRVSSAAAVLQLSERSTAPEGMRRIASAILDKCRQDQGRIITALRIYENHQMENPSGVLFLEDLLAGLPPSFIEARRRVTEILTKLLGRRVAPLCDRQTWDKLRLPAGLFQLLRN